MKTLIAMLVLASAMAALAACQTEPQYDGISRFADTGFHWDKYYGSGSPPRDS